MAGHIATWSSWRWPTSWREWCGPSCRVRATGIQLARRHRTPEEARRASRPGTTPLWACLAAGPGGSPPAGRESLWDGPSPPMTARMAVADHIQGGDGAMTIVTLGLDLGKNWIHMVGFDSQGNIVLSRRVRRRQLVTLTANMPACLIGMEACSGAHHLGRALEAQGHTVRLMPPQYVKPFVKANKNDYRDAEANAEAVQRPTMRFVPLKSAAQLDLQTIHRVRQRLVGRRTALINQLRASLLERGITVPQTRRILEKALASILADETNDLSPRMRRLIEDMRAERRGAQRRDRGVR